MIASTKFVPQNPIPRTPPSAAVHGIISLVPMMTDESEITLQHKKRLREMIAGYEAANEVIKEEKREWMQGMTPAESWEAFEDLMVFGRILQGDPTTLHVFEQRRIEELLHRRQILDEIARAQGYA